jgi:4'-phosphopantetheinyl transferase EntD
LSSRGELVQAEQMDDSDGALARALRDLRARYPTLSFASDRIADASGLTEDEALCAVDFVPRRRAEFAAGRRAARKALGRFGRGSSSVVASARGVPMYPCGYCGSITHKGGHAVAVAGLVTDITSVGIDLEFDMEPEEAELLSRVSTEREAMALDRLAAAGIESPATLILGAKEALFKALNPLDGEARDFQDVELSFDVDGSFVVSTVEPQDLAHKIVGAYVLCEGLLVSLVIVRPYGGV